MAGDPPLERALLQIAGGDPVEADLLRRALALARSRRSGPDVDSLIVPRFARSMTGVDAQSRGAAFRSAHQLQVSAAQVNIEELAFGGPTDALREEHSAFCYLMYQGYQQRFVDRHQGEAPEDFLDRPRKSTTNLTRLVIRTLSRLYQAPPSRKPQEGTPLEVVGALRDLWSDQFNLALLAVDRYTRLLGTVAVRPFWDPNSPGCVRLWAFMSHQLRVIPHPTRPWIPHAVIERHTPFRATSSVVIWTERSLVTIDERGVGRGRPHGLGRIPVTFFRDDLCYTSFFVEGRGRGLCDQNAVINAKLTDLNEIEQFQGFSVPIAINPEAEDVTVGPRQVLIFRPQNREEPFGLEFKRPDAPLDQLRAGIEADIRNVLREQNVPEAALGAELGQRALSGIAIRQAMSPIVEDNAERGRLFTPVEADLADVCLRVRAHHDTSFPYSQAAPPRFSIEWGKLEFPQDVAEQIAREEFDVAHGITTPAELMQRRWPTQFPTRAEAKKQWLENLDEIREGGPPPVLGDGSEAFRFEGDPVEGGPPPALPPGGNGAGERPLSRMLGYG